MVNVLPVPALASSTVTPDGSVLVLPRRGKKKLVEGHVTSQNEPVLALPVLPVVAPGGLPLAPRLAHATCRLGQCVGGRGPAVQGQRLPHPPGIEVDKPAQLFHRGPLS